MASKDAILVKMLFWCCSGPGRALGGKEGGSRGGQAGQ